MIASFTAEIFQAFIYGAIATISGGALFEGGKRYAKTIGSHQFKGKGQALPFFFLVLILGWLLQHLDFLVAELVLSVPPTARLGTMVLGTMILFNYSIDYFNYLDQKSVTIYAIGGLLALWPFI